MPRRPRTFASQLKGSDFDEGLVDVFGPAETVRGRKRQTWGVNFALRADWLVQLSPVALCDAACDVILKHHRESIRDGVRADTGAKQPQLARRGRTKDTDRKSQNRGFRDGDFADHVTRGKISERGPKFSQKRGKVTGPKLSVRRGRARPFATVARATIGAVDLGKPRDRRGNASDYVAFVSNEFDARGVEYFHVKGDMSQQLDTFLRGYMAGAVEGSAPAPTPGDVPAKSV